MKQYAGKSVDKKESLPKSLPPHPMPSMLPELDYRTSTTRIQLETKGEKLGPSRQGFPVT